ncbi:DUF2889 domain-containing protein [Sessilibacter sp. MAH1]
MPLPKPSPRRADHARTVTSQGYMRDDGLWDIDARMTDVKTDNMDHPERGLIPAGVAYHDISIRITVDETLLIKDVHVSMDSTPFFMCPNIAPAFDKLKDTRIGGGWFSEVRKRVGGMLGCTHVNELLPVVATTAFQCLWPKRMEHEGESSVENILNTCHTWAAKSDVIKNYAPSYYQPEDIIAKQES